MPLLHAIVLGIVQGATEFLPISSSGHLVLVPFIFGWDEPTVAFDVAVHAGTLVSVLYVFWERVRPMLRALRNPADERNRYLLTLLFLGTIPAAVLGLALTEMFESAFARPVLVSLLLGVTGWLMFTGDRLFAEQEENLRERQLAAARANVGGSAPAAPLRLRGEDELDATDALLVGVAQAASILPGISRSGATVVAAIRAGIDKETAIRFSFLLSIPAILGAIVVKLPDMIGASLNGEAPAMLVGVATSAVTGVVAIRFFIRQFVRRGLKIFGVYCFLLTIAGLLTALARG